jgi:hypothetical protein
MMKENPKMQSEENAQDSLVNVVMVVERESEPSTRPQDILPIYTCDTFPAFTSA